MKPHYGSRIRVTSLGARHGGWQPEHVTVCVTARNDERDAQWLAAKPYVEELFRDGGNIAVHCPCSYGRGPLGYALLVRFVTGKACRQILDELAEIRHIWPGHLEEIDDFDARIVTRQEDAMKDAQIWLDHAATKRWAPPSPRRSRSSSCACILLICNSRSSSSACCRFAVPVNRGASTSA